MHHENVNKTNPQIFHILNIYLSNLCNLLDYTQVNNKFVIRNYYFFSTGCTLKTEKFDEMKHVWIILDMTLSYILAMGLKETNSGSMMLV